MNIAVVLAAGSGSRIASDTPKQYIEILGKPILAYTLEIFETNKNIDAILVVTNDFDRVRDLRYLSYIKA